MKAKEYLSQINSIHAQVENKKERIERLRCLLESPGVPELKKDRIQTSIATDKMEKMVAEKAKLEDEMASLMYEEARLIYKIGQQIDDMGNKTYSRLLHMKYIGNKTLMDIADKLYYSYDYVREMHGYALEDFRKAYLT